MARWFSTIGGYFRLRADPSENTMFRIACGPLPDGGTTGVSPHQGLMEECPASQGGRGAWRRSTDA